MLKNQNIVVFDIGGTNTRAALVSYPGFVSLPLGRAGTTDDPEDSKSFIIKMVEKAKSEGFSINKVGISIAGTVDKNFFVSIGRWNRGIPVCEWNKGLFKEDLEESLDLPVFLINDVSAGVLAEYRFGGHPSPEKEKLMYLTISTGIGSGIIVEGKNPYSSGAGQFDFGDGLDWENHCGGRYVVGYFNDWVESNGYQIPFSIMDSKELFALKGHPVVDRFFEHYLDICNQMFCVLTRDFQPDIISLGGSLARNNRELYSKIQSPHPKTKIVFSSLDDDICLLGAAVYAVGL